METASGPATVIESTVDDDLANDSDNREAAQTVTSLSTQLLNNQTTAL